MRNIILFLLLSVSFLGALVLGYEVKIGDECDEYDLGCDNIENSLCENDVCECEEEYVASADNATCLPLATKLGDECEISQQCARIEDAECVGKLCVAAKGASGVGSVAKPGDPCAEDSQCSFAKGFCNGGTCAVQLATVPLNQTSDILGKICSSDSDCRMENTLCRFLICKCKDDFVPSMNLKQCLPKAKSLGDECEESVQCVSLNGSICEDRKCSGLMKGIGTRLLGNAAGKVPSLTIGSTCQTNEDCKHVTDALCKENVCQCTENFVTSVSSNSCLGKASKEGDVCVEDKQCEDVEGASCIGGSCMKPAVAATKLGKKSSASSAAPSGIMGVIFIMKICFL